MGAAKLGHFATKVLLAMASGPVPTRAWLEAARRQPRTREVLDCGGNPFSAEDEAYGTLDNAAT